MKDAMIGASEGVVVGSWIVVAVSEVLNILEHVAHLV